MMSHDNLAHIRPQYHFRPSQKGYYAWNVISLIQKSQKLPITQLPLAKIAELDEDYWSFECGKLTVRQIAEHFELVQAADLAYPVLLCAQGRVMDGMHRIVKALLNGDQTIAARQFQTTPDPDFVHVQPQDLTYD